MPTMMQEREVRALADGLEQDLRAAGTPERAAQEKRYLKSDLEFAGATVPQIRRAAKGFWDAHPGLTRGELLALAEVLWSRPLHERRMLAVEFLAHYCSLLTPEDIPFVERLIRESRTWALVDNLSALVVGGLVDRHPEICATLDRWAADGDFWVRRSALLAWLLPLRRGSGDFERFTSYADAMLEEREFFIRKAIGWVLRDMSRRRPKMVADWLRPRAHRTSGVTIREAVKHLAEGDRNELMAAYREKRPAASGATPWSR